MADVQNDWENNPEGYLQNEDGSFVLKANGTPKKRAGRRKGTVIRGYNYSSAQKAKMAARRAVKKQEKELTSLSKKVRSKKAKLENRKQIFKKLGGKKATYVLGLLILPQLMDDVTKTEKYKDFLTERRQRTVH